MQTNKLTTYSLQTQFFFKFVVQCYLQKTFNKHTHIYAHRRQSI